MEKHLTEYLISNYNLISSEYIFGIIYEICYASLEVELVLLKNNDIKIVIRTMISFAPFSLTFHRKKITNSIYESVIKTPIDNKNYI